MHTRVGRRPERATPKRLGSSSAETSWGSEPAFLVADAAGGLAALATITRRTSLLVENCPCVSDH